MKPMIEKKLILFESRVQNNPKCGFKDFGDVFSFTTKEDEDGSNLPTKGVELTCDPQEFVRDLSNLFVNEEDGTVKRVKTYNHPRYFFQSGFFRRNNQFIQGNGTAIVSSSKG